MDDKTKAQNLYLEMWVMDLWVQIFHPGMGSPIPGFCECPQGQAQLGLKLETQ